MSIERIIDLGRIARSTAGMEDLARGGMLRAGKHDLRGVGIGVQRNFAAVERTATQLEGLAQAHDGVELLRTAGTALRDAYSVVTGPLPRRRPFPFGHTRVDASAAADLLGEAASAIRSADARLLQVPGVERVSAASSTLLLRGGERADAAVRAAGHTRRSVTTPLTADVADWVDVSHWRGPQRLLTSVTRPLVDARYRLEAHGTAHVPVAGSTLVVGTHGSVGDSLKYGNHLGRPYRVMAALEPFINPVSRGLFRHLGGFPVDRTGGAAAEHALAVGRGVLEAGELLVMFPEGVVANLPDIIEPRRGAALLALQTGAAVVPSAAVGLEPSFVRGTMRGRGAHLVFGEPLYFRTSPNPDRAQVGEAQELIQQRAEELHGMARERYRRGAT